MNGDPPAVRVCRALVRLYPRAFREEYGRDMVHLVSCQCRDESARVVLWRTVRDLLTDIPRQRLEATMQHPPTRLVPYAALAVGAAGLTLAFVAGTDGPVVLLGLLVFVTGLVVAAATLRRAASAQRPALRGHGWWQTLLAGPALVGLVLVSAQLGVEAWFLGMICVLLAIALSSVGLGLGVLRLVTRRRHGPHAGTGALPA